MNMKKTFGVKKLIVLIFSLALVVLLAACGGTGSPANGGTDIPAKPAPSHPYNIGYINVGGRNIDIRVLASAGLTPEQKDAMFGRFESALALDWLQAHDNFSGLNVIAITAIGSTNASFSDGVLSGRFPSLDDVEMFANEIWLALDGFFALQQRYKHNSPCQELCC